VTEEPVGRWQRIQRSVGGVRWLIGGLALVCVVVGLGLVVWNGRSLALDLIQDVTARKFPATEWLDRDEFARWRADASRVQPVVLDARSPAEYTLSHLRGAARIDPREPSLKSVAAFPRDTPVVVYCRVGYRSARVASWLRRQGFRTVYDLAGGLFAWADEGRPLAADGRPATQVHPYSTSWGKLLAPAVRADAPPVADPLSLP
jgi:rhodanese-related sulfurtransferase